MCGRVVYYLLKDLNTVYKWQAHELYAALKDLNTIYKGQAHELYAALKDLNTICEGQAHELYAALKDLNALTENDMLCILAVSRALYFIHIDECLLYTRNHFVRLYYVYINHNIPTMWPHKLAEKGPERDRVTDLNECLCGHLSTEPRSLLCLSELAVSCFCANIHLTYFREISFTYFWGPICPYFFLWIRLIPS